MRTHRVDALTEVSCYPPWLATMLAVSEANVKEMQDAPISLLDVSQYRIQKMLQRKRKGRQFSKRESGQFGDLEVISNFPSFYVREPIF